MKRAPHEDESRSSRGTSLRLRSPQITYLLLVLIPVTVGLRLYNFHEEVPSGLSYRLTVSPERVWVEATILERGPVRLAWPSEAEPFLEQISLSVGSGDWSRKDLSESEPEAGGLSLLKLSPSSETRRVRWAYDPPSRWSSTASGIGSAGTLVIPTKSLLPRVDPQPQRTSFEFITPESVAKEHRIVTSFGTDRDAPIELEDAQARKRLGGGIFVQAPLTLARSVHRGGRSLRIWSEDPPAQVPDAVSNAVDLAFSLLPDSPEETVSDLVLLPEEFCPPPRALSPWFGCNLASESEDTVVENATATALAQLMADLPRDPSPWLYHGFREVAKAWILSETTGSRLGEVRRELYDRYSCGRVAWNHTVAQGPTNGSSEEIRFWTQVTCPLAVDVLITRFSATMRDGVEKIARILCAGWANERDSIDRLLGARAAKFYEEQILDLSILPLSEGLKWIPVDKLPSEVAESQASETHVFICTTKSDGYLENCGCTVNQSGGAARRNEALRTLKIKHPQALVLDVGYFLPPITPEEEEAYPPESETVLQALQLAPYDCLVPSPWDLGLMARLRSEHDEPGAWRELALVAGNMQSRRGDVFWSGEKSISRGEQCYRVLGLSSPQWEIGGVYDSWEGRIRTRPVLRGDPLTTAKEWRGRHSSDWEDTVNVLCGQIAPIQMSSILEAVDGVDVVITPRVRTLQPLPDGESVLYKIEPGAIGKTLILCPTAGSYGIEIFTAVRDLASREWRALKHQYVALDDSVEEDSETRALIDSFYEREAPAETWALAPLFPEHGTSGRFVGSNSCRECHEEAWNQWRVSGHGTAYDTLLEAHRHYVPKCVQCHVVGMGLQSGYERTSEDRGNLKGVGCEQCHGPGERHVQSGGKASIDRFPPGDGCQRCHDSEHSPGFTADPSGYMEKIRHWPSRS